MMIDRYYAEKIKKLKEAAYGKPLLGYYALEAKGALQWHNCRENFNKKLNSDCRGFYFCHSPFEGRGVAAFLHKTEKIISVSGAINFSTYEFTDDASVIWINISDFWLKNEIRRQFLTILLRCGLSYIPKLDNYDEALWSKYYTKETKLATYRFLFGFTEFSSLDHKRTIGWVDFFGKRDLSHVRRYLTNSLNYKKNLVGVNSVWQ